jgi:hypothetical protein
MSIYGNFIGVLTAHTLYIPADVSHGTVDTDSDDAEPRSRKKSKISQRENDGYSTEGDDKRKLEEEIKRLKEKLASQKSSAGVL